MSNWNFINQHRCRIATPTVPAFYCTDDSAGWNGMFRLPISGQIVRVVASDGEGWRHVSVSVEFDSRPPTWAMMCKIKDLFWDDEDVVIQYHPRKSEYVNNAVNCLHLWQPYDGKSPLPFPTPPSIMVGIK